MKVLILIASLTFVGSARTFAQAPAANTPPAAAPSPVESFTVGDEGRAFNSAAARGNYIAVHFLLTAECPLCMRHVHEYVEKAPTLAGVTHIFVRNVPVEQFSSALAGEPDLDKLPLYRDVDGKLAAKLGVASDYAFKGTQSPHPTLVLLDPSGKEVFRAVGKDNADRFAFAAFAQKFSDLTKDRESREGNTEKGLALSGYDPVAYIDDKAAVEGKKELASSFRGTAYRFASAAHREKFNAAPAKYLPEYGGWCATAMAKGDKVEIDPKNFRITSGRLFLFYKGFLGDAQKDWSKDEPALTQKADGQWKKLTASK